MRFIKKSIISIATVLFVAFFCVSCNKDQTFDSMNIPPTYPPCFFYSENNSLSDITLSCDLDAKAPMLKTNLSIQQSSPTILHCIVPFYDSYVDVNEKNFSLTINGKSIAPRFSYSERVHEISELSYMQILETKIDLSALPDKDIPVYKYSFSSSDTGTISFTVPFGSILFESFQNYYYSSANNGYNVTTSPELQYFYCFSKDINHLSCENTDIVRTEMTCGEFIREAVLYLSELLAEINVDAPIHDIVIAKLAECFSSGARIIDYEHAFLMTPFDHGFVFAEYDIELPTGKNDIKFVQPLQYCLNTDYEPFIQCFNLNFPNYDKITLQLTSDRQLLYNTIAFQQKNNLYQYIGDCKSPIQLYACTNSAPQNKFPQKRFATWQIVGLSISGTVAVVALVYLIFNAILSRKNKSPKKKNK